MKLAYVTIKNAQQLGKGTEWSGTGYHIAQALEEQSIGIDYLGPLRDALPMKALRKLKRHYYQSVGKVYFKDTEPVILRRYARQVAAKLEQDNYDAVLSATSNPIAYLESQKPTLFWADATFQNTAEFYPKYSNLCQASIDYGHQMERLALEKCRFAIYSSNWAADTAIDFYKADPEKVHVIPFGANLTSNLSSAEIKSLVNTRPSSTCKLIFIGVDWIRKGGDKALAVAKALNKAGLPTELTLVGTAPDDGTPLPDYVKSMGYISKLTAAGQQQISQLIGDAHFLILPTLADCSPIVLCEANAFGVPCLSTDIGGIPTIIKSNINGQLFSPQAGASDYCTYIMDLFTNYNRYKKMCLSSFEEYKDRLNWQVAGKTAKALLNRARQ